MRKITLISILMVGYSLTIQQLVAQNIRGGFGHGAFGPVYNISPSIINDLKDPFLLGNDIKLNGLAMLGGGGGYGLLKNNILIGGSGFGYKIADATSRGQATFSIGGGFVNLGYLVIAKRSMIAYPYIGIGATGMNLKLKNNTSGESFNLGSAAIAPGQRKNFNCGGMGFEIGYAVKLLTFSIDEVGPHGGFMVGLQAGTYFFSGVDDWYEEKTDDVISTFSRPNAFSPYLRITIGGGGFNVSGN